MLEEEESKNDHAIERWESVVIEFCCATEIWSVMWWSQVLFKRNLNGRLCITIRGAKSVVTLGPAANRLKCSLIACELELDFFL